MAVRPSVLHTSDFGPQQYVNVTSMHVLLQEYRICWNSICVAHTQIERERVSECVNTEDRIV